MRLCRCLPRGADHTQQRPRSWHSSGRPVEEATPLPSPQLPAHPAPHPPAGMSPWIPRGLASLAEGGAVAGGSRCHLHLAALGTGDGSSSTLPPGAMGIPCGLVAEGGGEAGGDVRPPMCGAGQPQSSASTAQGAGCPQGMLSGKSSLPHSAQPFWGTEAPTGTQPSGEPAPHAPGTDTDTGLALPGTTPLVAIALMEMAVSIVCGKKHSVGIHQSSCLAGQGSGETWGHAGTRDSPGTH